ncbi:MAG TPA: YfcE family phosphodiesterase [Candidatus Avichristensenella intestinipullorum]|uniref:Phosphoesterase n=1 Tax=Candidatus Avichristensenella intestinipullorum TaxID=2840693 RepID=A0A9D0YYE2_9FIRM|nr:YfcE family phosphodiesterase [Candidatus Avichristensenella intestinipullorum]
MLIACAGDAHGAREYTDALVAALPGVEAFCYLGDGEEDALRLQYALAERQPNAAFYAVRGNCDVFSRLPETLEVRFGRTKALVTHGHLFRVKLTCSLLAEAARRRECRLALFGHTHRPACETEGGVCLVNPGALAQGKWALVRVGEDGDIHAALRAL